MPLIWPMVAINLQAAHFYEHGRLVAWMELPLPSTRTRQSFNNSINGLKKKAISELINTIPDEVSNAIFSASFPQENIPMGSLVTKHPLANWCMSTPLVHKKS